jgi:hypothetical protein
MDDYIVCCHLCPAGHYEGDVYVNPGDHLRSTTRLIGSPEYGWLWHCPAHATNCPTCPRGGKTDFHPADPGPYRERLRHRASLLRRIAGRD